jgi:DNA-binding NtrC family response regulator
MVLLVEDDAGLRQLETAMLERMGLRVLSADCDYQARWLWDRHWREIDVLLTDVMIPSCTTGFELARRFRAEKPNLEVIYASGFSREIAGEDAAQLRDTLFLQKPFGQERLGKAIAACLESARRRLGREPGGLASR